MEIVPQLLRAIGHQRSRHRYLGRRLARDAVERSVVEAVGYREEIRERDARLRVELKLHIAVRRHHFKLAVESTALWVERGKRAYRRHAVEVGPARADSEGKLAVDAPHRNAVVAPELGMHVEVHEEVAVDEIDIPRTSDGNRLGDAGERVHVLDGRRDVERHEKRPYVRLAGLAARRGMEALLVEIEVDRAVYGHRTIDVGPEDANIAELEPPRVRPHGRDDALRRYAEDVWANECDGERRDFRKLHLHASAALAVPGKVVAVVQARDLKPDNAGAPKKEIDRRALCADDGLDWIGPLAVVEPDTAHPCATAKAERGGVALEHDVRRNVRAYGRNDPVGGNSLLTEKKAPQKYAKNDEGPLHRFHQEFRYVLHSCRKFRYSFSKSSVWQPLGESNSSYLDENQMS